MSKLRFDVVRDAFNKKPVKPTIPQGRPEDYFAKNVFNREKMYKYLTNEV